MRKVILTNEQNRSINDDTRRVVTEEGLRLFTAVEAARILHVSRNAVYSLWRDGQLDFWQINGTMTTNLTAIQDFLERTKNKEEDM